MLRKRVYTSLDNEPHSSAETGGWSLAGCRTDSKWSRQGSTRCICDHLTSFAVLMKVADTKEKVLFISCMEYKKGVVDRTHYTRIFQFPLRINVKISEHAPNFNVFKPRLVCRRILILPSGSSGKKFQFFFNNLTHTVNLVIGLKFRKNLKF